MSKPHPMSRRERQIMDIIFARGEATVREIQASLDDPPTDMAIRRLIHILEEKGHVKRRKEGRSVVYRPVQSRKKAGVKALKHVLNTFFDGAVDEALAAHFANKEKITPVQLSRMQKMISDAKKNAPTKSD